MTGDGGERRGHGPLNLGAPRPDMIYAGPLDPGAPLEPLPGHSSRGRLERVLRAGEFAVTAELSPPDSADPHEVHERASIFDGWVDAINATDGSGANCHMSSVGVCALLDPGRLRAGDADLVPRQQPDRDPGRRARRRRDGRRQRALPDRRRHPVRRSPRGASPCSTSTASR